MLTVVIGTIICIGVLSTLLILRFRQLRRDERLIRAWVDEHCYALVSLRGPSWRLGNTYQSYDLTVQEESGGQFSLDVEVSFFGHVTVQRW